MTPPISVRAMNTTVQKADDVGLEWPRPDEIPGCVRIFGFESNIPSSDARQHFDWEVVAEGKSAWIHVDDQSQLHVLLLRCYASQHGKPGSNCFDCSDNPRRNGLRWVWVRWEEFLEHHFFKYQYNQELAGRYNAVAFPNTAESTRHKNAYLGQFITRGVVTPTGSRPFDECDSSIVKKGFFPYDLDEVRARAAWQDEYGD